MANTLITPDEAVKSFMESINKACEGLTEEEKRLFLRELATWLADMPMEGHSSVRML
jgi:hypothetical protein